MEYHPKLMNNWHQYHPRLMNDWHWLMNQIDDFDSDDISPYIHIPIY